ncbi:hypothetical protein QTP88_017789 [Uroleucon formosanum]
MLSQTPGNRCIGTAIIIILISGGGGDGGGIISRAAFRIVFGWPGFRVHCSEGITITITIVTHTQTFLVKLVQYTHTHTHIGRVIISKTSAHNNAPQI